MNLGLDALAKGDPLTAKAQLLDALALNAENAQIEAAWGYYLMKTGDITHAALAYQKAIKLAPANAQIQNDYAVFLYQQQKYRQALSYFLKAAEDETYLYSGLAYENASLTAQHLGDVNAAQIYHQKALLQMP